MTDAATRQRGRSGARVGRWEGRRRCVGGVHFQGETDANPSIWRNGLFSRCSRAARVKTIEWVRPPPQGSHHMARTHPSCAWSSSIAISRVINDLSPTRETKPPPNNANLALSTFLHHCRRTSRYAIYRNCAAGDKGACRIRLITSIRTLPCKGLVRTVSPLSCSIAENPSASRMTGLINRSSDCLPEGSIRSAPSSTTAHTASEAIGEGSAPASNACDSIKNPSASSANSSDRLNSRSGAITWTTTATKEAFPEQSRRATCPSVAS